MCMVSVLRYRRVGFFCCYAAIPFTSMNYVTWVAATVGNMLFCVGMSVECLVACGQ